MLKVLQLLKNADVKFNARGIISDGKEINKFYNICIISPDQPENILQTKDQAKTLSFRETTEEKNDSIGKQNDDDPSRNSRSQVLSEIRIFDYNFRDLFLVQGMT